MSKKEINIIALYSGPPYIKWNTDKKLSRDFRQMENYVNDINFLPMPIAPYVIGSINFILRKVQKKKQVKKTTFSPSRLNIDVIYQYGAEFLVLQKRKVKIPVVKTVGFPMMREKLKIQDSELQLIADNIAKDAVDIDCLHFHTDISRNGFIARRPDFAEKCITIPFFMPHLKFINIENIESKFRNQKKIEILFVGSDGERKGLLDLCIALDLISEELIKANVFFTVISRTKPVCKKFLSIKHLEWAPQDEITTFMERSHIFAMPTREDSFGLVYVEAMAQGCAVICDDDFPRREIFDGNGAIHVPSKSPKLLSESILDLILNPSQQCKMAKMGWIRAKKIYSPEIVALKYKELFSSLVNKKS